MCNAASGILTKDREFWMETSDSHEEIIAHFKLHEGAGRINFARFEISPPSGNLSLPLKQWLYKIDQMDLPEWYDAKDAERRARVMLKAWAKSKLTGWRVKEAFAPVNPFKLSPKKLTRATALRLVAEWASVRASVWASVRASVRASVGDSVGAYTGSLFVPRIKSWKYAEKLGENPWKPLRTLWMARYVPSFDGTKWRLHAGPKAEAVYEFTKDEVDAVKNGRKQ